MGLFGREVPLRKLWTSNLLVSSVVHFALLVISTMSGSPVLFILCLFGTVLSCLVLVDWKYLSLILNTVGQVISVIALFFVYSCKSLNCGLKARWQKEAVKWVFPIFCLHSACVTLTIIGLKRRYKVKDDHPLREVITLLKDCDSYFNEVRKRREKMLEEKKLENEMRRIEIQKEEEVAKKIVDGLYGFTNRSNFPEFDVNLDKQGENNVIEEATNRNKINPFDKDTQRRVDELGLQSRLGNDQSPNFNFRISIPEELEPVEPYKDQNSPYIQWDSRGTFNHLTKL
ncbi:hypothetical protein MACJ_003720 [Theileria orientalis]|uniref:Transmembrane protein n=1 Tax=Theileria orientalis TaxID=68886 RepID=A0A976SLK9_THEOR|nr:hypothetical protein MACJ_003720 [Theileria orientalis]